MATGPANGPPEPLEQPPLGEHQVDSLLAGQRAARVDPGDRVGQFAYPDRRMHDGLFVRLALLTDRGQCGRAAVTQHIGARQEVLDTANHRVRHAVLHRHETLGDLPRQPPPGRLGVDGAVQRMGDERVPDAEIAEELVAVLPVEVGVPDARVGQCRRREACVARAQPVLDVIPLEEHRHRKADRADHLRRDEA